MDRRWRRVDVEVHIDVHIHTSLLIIFSFHFALFPPGNSEMAGCSSSGKGGMMVVAWKRCVSCVNCLDNGNPESQCWHTVTWGWVKKLMNVNKKELLSELIMIT